MGQAAIDLPDIENQAPALPGSSDELLLQLAGQEIDRLLAESDTKPIPPVDLETNHSEPTPEPEAITDSPEEAAKLQQLLEPAPIEAEIASAAEGGIDSQIDDLLRQLDGAAPVAPAAETKPADPAPVATPPPATIVAEALKADLMQAAPAAPAPAAPAPEQPTSAAERAALTPAVEPEPQLEKVLSDLPKNRAALLVRVLEIVNRPFDSCPDGVRDVLGKVAILTLMNSIGVLVYVMMFRSHGQ